MTKYVVSGYIGFDNFGDEAIARVLAKYLKDNNAEKITWISSNPQKTSRLYNVNSCKMLDFIKPIMETDVLISGGGSLLQDLTSLKSLLYYSAVIFTALIFKKKVIIFAQGFTPFRTKTGEILTKFILKRCYKISVRDFKSHELLKSWGINSELVSDPVFGITIPNNEQHGVGIQLRSYPNLTDEFLLGLAKQIALRFPQKQIHLISLQDSIDISVLKNFQKLLSEQNIKSEIISNLSVENAIERISKLKYLISMRFHACLVGTMAGVKVLGINYDEKVQKLANEISFPVLELNQTDFDKSFDELINLDIQNYKIPKFSFPNIAD